MKIILDPVYTSLPSKCSTVYLMLQIVDRLIEERDDVFFRLLIPKHLLENAEEVAYLERPGRLTLHGYEGVHTDRIREMMVLGQDMADLLHPAGPLWDCDAIVTSRMGLLAQLRMNSSRRSSYDNGGMRYLLGLEEMPMFSFSNTVAWTEADWLSALSLANYQASDHVIVSSFWAKRKIMQVAREHLAPSKVRALEQKISEAAPVVLERLRIKETGPTDVMNVVFSGRAVASANFADVAELFRKQFSFPIGKMKMDFIVSTNSLGVAGQKFGDMSMIGIEQNGREEFYKFLDERAHVAVNLSDVGDFSLSTYEMLLHGVPVIVPDRAWTEFLGPTYPFRVKSETEAYAWINAFAKDWKTTYAMFAGWEGNYWSWLVTQQEGRSTPEAAAGRLQLHETQLQAWMVERKIGQAYVDLLAKQEGDKLDIVKMLDDEKMLSPTSVGFRNVVGRTPIFQMIKQLALVQGWKDTLETGVVVR